MVGLMYNSPQAMSKAAWITVFVVLLASALPALFHLPLWVTLIAVMAVIWRLLKARIADSWLNKTVVPVLLFAGLAGIYFSFASLFGGDAILSFFVMVVALKWSESTTRRDGLLMIFAAVILSAIGGMYWQSLLSLLHMLLVALLLLAALFKINDSQNSLNWRELLTKVASFFLISLPLMVLFFVTVHGFLGQFGILVSLLVCQ